MLKEDEVKAGRIRIEYVFFESFNNSIISVENLSTLTSFSAKLKNH